MHSTVQAGFEDPTLSVYNNKKTMGVLLSAKKMIQYKYKE